MSGKSFFYLNLFPGSVLVFGALFLGGVSSQEHRLAVVLHRVGRLGVDLGRGVSHRRDRRARYEQ